MIMHHIIAMKRSGQHGVINWLKAQYEDNKETYKGAKEHSVKVHNNSGINVLKRAAGQMSYWVYPHWNLSRRTDWSIKDRPIFINNYEDVAATQVIPQIMAYAGCPPFNAYEHQFWINLRDPYNCFASRFRNPEVRNWVTDDVMRALWVDHATIRSNERYLESYKVSVLTHRNHMNMCDGDVIRDPPPVHYILFNDWFASKFYRDDLARKLGLENTERGRERIGRYPSSFDGDKYEGSASKMKVLERWPAYQNDTEYREQLTPEIVKLATDIFGPLDATRAMGLETGE